MKPDEGSTGVEKRTDAEKILDELQMTDDGYIHYSTILPVLEERIAALKELIPIAEAYHSLTGKGKSAIDNAKKLTQ